jgi:hypothetical protein
MPLKNLARGTHAKGGEILDWTYYDSMNISAVLSNQLFQLSLGQGSPAKTLDQTNMTVNGQIPTGQRMTAHRIKFMYVSQSTSWASAGTAQVQKWYSMLAKTTLRVHIPGKDDLIELTLQELLGACTLVADVPTVSGDNIPIIKPRYHGIFPLNKPLVLAQNTSFTVYVEHQTAPDAALYTGTGDIIKIGLNGILERRS